MTIRSSDLQLDASAVEVPDQRVVSLSEFQTESLLQSFLLLFGASDLSSQLRDLQHHPAAETGHLPHSEEPPRRVNSVSALVTPASKIQSSYFIPEY